MGNESSVGEGSLRQRILDTALEILLSAGIKKLTQPKVAAAAGIRQSHLTYYFPKKIDLIQALLGQHTSGAHHPVAGSIFPALRMIVADCRRIRFFTGLVIEAEQQPLLRRMLHDHMAEFDALVAQHFGRSAGDADIAAFMAALRGFGVQQLLRDIPADIDVEALAARFGLMEVSHPLCDG